MTLLREQRVDDAIVTVAGTLERLGVAAAPDPGAPLRDIIDLLQRRASANPGVRRSGVHSQRGGRPEAPRAR